MKHTIVQDDLQIQIVLIAIFLITFEAHTNILFILQVKILVLIKWSYSPPPQIMLTIECEIF